MFAPARPIAHVARDLGIHRQALRRRVRRDEADRAPRPLHRAAIPAEIAVDRARHPVNRHRGGDGPNYGWSTSPTCAPFSGFSSPAFILDDSSRMIVGRQIAAHMRTETVLDAPEMAARPGPTRRRPGGPPGSRQPVHPDPLHVRLTDSARRSPAAAARAEPARAAAPATRPTSVDRRTPQRRHVTLPMKAGACRLLADVGAA